MFLVAAVILCARFGVVDAIWFARCAAVDVVVANMLLRERNVMNVENLSYSLAVYSAAFGVYPVLKSQV